MSQEQQQSDLSGGTADATTPEDGADTDDDSSDEPEYKRATLYFRQPLKKEYDRWLKIMELEHEVAEEAERREIHEAIIRTAMDNVDQIIEDLESDDE